MRLRWASWPQRLAAARGLRRRPRAGPIEGRRGDRRRSRPCPTPRSWPGRRRRVAGGHRRLRLAGQSARPSPSTPTTSVTNRHVVANDTSPTLVSPGRRRAPRSGHRRRPTPSTSPSSRSTTSCRVTLQWAPTDALQPGEHVVVLGYPAPSLTFTTTVGSIVNFQGRDGAREADAHRRPHRPRQQRRTGAAGRRHRAPGVVTQMTLDDPTERAAIVFSAASVESEVARFIAEPDDDVLLRTAASAPTTCRRCPTTSTCRPRRPRPRRPRRRCRSRCPPSRRRRPVGRPPRPSGRRPTTRDPTGADDDIDGDHRVAVPGGAPAIGVESVDAAPAPTTARGR